MTIAERRRVEASVQLREAAKLISLAYINLGSVSIFDHDKVLRSIKATAEELSETITDIPHTLYG